MTRIRSEYDIAHLLPIKQKHPDFKTACLRQEESLVKQMSCFAQFIRVDDFYLFTRKFNNLIVVKF